MSKTLLNRLAMFETLDTRGPLTISELARQSGLDITVVSRTVAACEPDGWLMRVNGRVTLGPRFTLLGNSGPTADAIAASAPLIHAIAGVTGILTQAYGLVGTQSVLIATAEGRTPSGPAGLATKAPLYATAGGRAIAVQLLPDRLDALLPTEPFPSADALIASLLGTFAEPIFAHPLATSAESVDSTLPRSRAELIPALDEIRTIGFAFDIGALDPAIHCIAIPWPQPGLAASLACMGSAEAIAASADLIRAALTAAAQPGASPGSIVAAAAAIPVA